MHFYFTLWRLEMQKETQNLITLLQSAYDVLALPYGNLEPEQGFSIIKYLVSIHGCSTKNKTIESLRLVKYYLIERGLNKVIVRREMIKLCERVGKDVLFL